MYFYGRTPGCSACRGLTEKGSRQGRVHSTGCLRRYKAFLEESFAEETRKAREEQQQREGQSSERHQQQQPKETKEGQETFGEREGETRNDENKTEEIREPARRVTGKNPLLDDNVRKRKAPVPEASASSHFEDMEIDTDEAVVPEFSTGDVERSHEKTEVFQKKRAAETSTEALEAEIRDTNVTVDGCLLDSGLRRVDDCSENALRFHIDGNERTPATSPETVDMMVNAVRFSPDASGHEEFVLGGSKVLLWKPSGALCETAGIELDPELVFELRHLEECQTGTVVTEEEAQDLKARKPHTRMISTRWVTTFKNPQKVRCRVVARDIARGETARSLGYSSPTPSAEALQMCLCICAEQNFRLLAVDAEHAFMHARMPADQSVALRLPLSISGPVRYLELSKALNGLRDASLRWLQLLSSAMPPGISSCDSEPCVYFLVKSWSKAAFWAFAWS